MILDELCTPALIYIVFSLTQIGIDTYIGSYKQAFMKLWVAIIVFRCKPINRIVCSFVEDRTEQ